MTPLYNSDSHSRHPNVPSRGCSSGWSSGQVLLPTAVRILHRTTALGGRVNDVGSTAWERVLATEFQVGAHGYAGQASSRSSGSSNTCGRRRALSGSRARHMERIVLGGSQWAAGDTLARETLRARRMARAASRLERSQESATDVVIDVSLMTAVLDT